MARTTKLELEQALIASQRDNAALRLALSESRANVESLRTLLRNEEHRVAMLSTPKATPVAWPDAPQRTLPAHFAAAREAAMRLGRAVKVSA